MNLLQIEYFFLLFWIYSFAGWFIESVDSLLFNKKFVNRGFLLGPYCPIYGIGVVFITLFLSKYEGDIMVIFSLSAILCGTLEYLTSYLMEKLFKARWWDYSNMKFNINGRICLETLVLFAIAGVFIIHISNPLLEKGLALLPEIAIHIIAITLFLIFFVDCIISLKVMSSVRSIKISVVNQIKDNTEEISTKVKEILLAKSAPYRRILAAFPQAFSDKIKEGKEKFEKTAQKVKEIAGDTIQEVKEKANDTLQEAKDKASKTIQDVMDKSKDGRNKFLKNYKFNTKLSLMKINRESKENKESDKINEVKKEKEGEDE